MCVFLASIWFDTLILLELIGQFGLMLLLFCVIITNSLIEFKCEVAVIVLCVGD